MQERTTVCAPPKGPKRTPPPNPPPLFCELRAVVQPTRNTKIYVKREGGIIIRSQTPMHQPYASTQGVLTLLKKSSLKEIFTATHSQPSSRTPPVMAALVGSLPSRFGLLDCDSSRCPRRYGDSQHDPVRNGRKGENLG